MRSLTILSFALWLAFPNSTSAQGILDVVRSDEVKKKGKVKKEAQELTWRLGILGNPDFYSLRAAENLAHEYTEKVGYKMGLNTSLQIGERNVLTLKPCFTSMEYDVNYVYDAFQAGDPQLPDFASISSQYIDLPLEYSFKFVAKKWFRAFVTAGFNGSFLISSNDLTTFADGSVRESGFLNSIVAGTTIGGGAELRLTKKWSLRLDLLYRYFFNGIDTQMDQNPGLFSSSLGFARSLGKKDKD